MNKQVNTGFYFDNYQTHYLKMNLRQLILPTIIFLLSWDVSADSYDDASSHSYANSFLSEPLMFRLQKTKQEYNRERTKISIAVSGGTKPYSYYFDEYPQYWSYINQDLYIPTTFNNIDRRYPIKIRVVDSKGSQARATIVIQVSDGQVYLYNQLYPYDQQFDDSFFNKGTFRGRPKMVKSGSFYQNTDNIDMSGYNGYVPFQILKYDKENVNQLNSGSVTNSVGTGLGSMFNINTMLQNIPQANKQTLKVMTSFINPTKFGNAPNFTINSKDVNANPNLNGSENKNVNGNGNGNNKNPGLGNSNSYESLLNTYYNNLGLNKDQNKNTFSPSQLKSINKTAKVDVSMYLEPKVTTTPQTTIIQKGFFKFPSQQQIDNLIVQLDIFSLSKIIQDVNKTTSITCEQKNQYLNSLLGRVESAISMKKFSLQQLQIISTSANTEYGTLTLQIAQKKAQLAALNITELKNKLNVDLLALEKLYSQFNSADSKINPYQQEIDILTVSIATLKSKSQVDRSQIVKQQISLTEADAYAQKIQKQLNEIRSQKMSLELAIQKSQSSIQNSQIQGNINPQIIKLQQQISALQLKSDQYKLKYQKLQTAVSRYRSDISRGAKKEDELIAEISQYQQKLSLQRKKLLNDQLTKLTQMVSTLQGSLPSIESLIDSNYYTCYRATDVSTQSTETNVIYIVPANNVQIYLESSYQLKIDINNLKIGSKEIRFTPINILDSAWQTSFGQPYDIIQYASSKDFSFAQDFNCLNPSNLISGFGVITKISSREIVIDNLQGTTYYLNLGTCSRIQTSQLLPTIGQRIFWRGVPGGINNQFNIYRASCI